MTNVKQIPFDHLFLMSHFKRNRSQDSFRESWIKTLHIFKNTDYHGIKETN